MSNLADLAKKKNKPKYDMVLSRLFTMTPQRALYAHLIREHTLKGKEKTNVNIMCLTMIDPTISWFDTI